MSEQTPLDKRPSAMTAWALEMLEQGLDAMREDPDYEGDEWARTVVLKESVALVRLCQKIDALLAGSRFLDDLDTGLQKIMQETPGE